MSRKHGKNVGVKNTPLPFYQERFNAMKRWLLLVASTLGFTSNTLPTKEEEIKQENNTNQILNNFAEVIEKVATQTQVKEKIVTPPTPEEKKEDDDDEEEDLSWGQKLYSAMVQSQWGTSQADEFKSLWNEKINDILTEKEFKTIDQQFRKELNDDSAIYTYNTSLLCVAAEYLGLNYVTQLLKLGADAGEVITNLNNKIDMTPLFASTTYTAVDGFKVAQALLKNGAISTINKQVLKRNMSALHRAVYGNKFELVKLLVENGALLDLQDKYGDTPLHYAAKLPDQEAKDKICRYLLENGADGNARNNKGKAPWQRQWQWQWQRNEDTYPSFDAWLKHLYPNQSDREKAIEKNTKAMEKFKK